MCIKCFKSTYFYCEEFKDLSKVGKNQVNFLDG